MDRKDLLAMLQVMLEEDRGEKYDSISETAKLRDDLGLDSVDLVTLVMQVQDKFRIVLASDELEKIVTVADLVDILAAKIGQKPLAA
jgi:acyl carrier protein